MFVVVLAMLATTASAITVDSITTSIMKDGHLFVHVTSGSLSGWGQNSYNNEKTDLYTTVADKVHSFVAPYALGQNFSSTADIDAFADTVWRKNYKRTGTVLARALAGVDTALYDLLGRSEKRSVCSLVADLLGGACRQRVPVYGSNGDRHKKPKDIVANAVNNRDEYGVKAFKFQIANRMGADVDIKPNRTEELIPLARQQLGPDITLMVDANGGFDNYSHASRISKLLIEHNYTWFEEPFPYWEYDLASNLLQEVRPQGLGIALGEQEYRLDVWERNIHAMQYAQPDVHYIGGFSRTLRVAKMSISANTTLVPHSPNPCMVDVFALTLMAAAPNAYKYMEFDAINTRHPPSGNQFFAEKVFELDKTDGTMAVPQGPGWGVTLRPGLLSDAVNQTSHSGHHHHHRHHHTDTHTTQPLIPKVVVVEG